jgi:hypothetical protein
MKHVRKKCLVQHTVGDDIAKLFSTAPVDEDALTKLRTTDYRGYYALSLTSGNELIQTFKYNFRRDTIFLPELHPIVLYFHVAQRQLESIKEEKAFLLLEAKGIKDIGALLNRSYGFFGTATCCAIFLFNAIEAMTNLLIPEQYVYSVGPERKKVVYNKEGIQRDIRFEEKIKEVVPDATKTGAFHLQRTSDYDRLIRLKQLRDEIVHTKTDIAAKPNYYERLYNDLLGFDFEKAAIACRNYVNFYSPDLIEDCPCGKNF